MKQHSIEFFKKDIEELCHGTVLWRETVQVPEDWWKGCQRPNEVPCNLQESMVHVFDVKREEADLVGDSSVRWMGEHGVAFAWSYRRNGRWYYTVTFKNPETGVDDPETAVRYRSHGGARPCR